MITLSKKKKKKILFIQIKIIKLKNLCKCTIPNDNKKKTPTFVQKFLFGKISFYNRFGIHGDVFLRVLHILSSFEAYAQWKSGMGNETIVKDDTANK